jgi:hypothetical protein
MQNEKHKSSSVSSALTREQLLKMTLDECPEMLLMVVKQFGQDSTQFMMAERLTDLVKREYEFLVAKREYHDLCNEHHMRLDMVAIREISNLAKVKKAINEMGLN